MKFIFAAACLAFVAATALPAQSAPYDPLKAGGVDVGSKTFEIKDAKRDRVLPIRVYLPDAAKPAPVILFSHGLGGSRDNNPYLGNHWAKRGYVVAFIQHPGSDEDVWKGIPAGQRMISMKKAASFENLKRRGEDVPVVIDQLTAWNADKQNPLCGRLDLSHIGMSGHSFGGTTTQAVAGQTIGGGRISFLEPRIRAAVIMSPSIPVLGDPATAFAAIKIPCLLMTGTLDTSPIGNSTAEDRLKVFPALSHAPAWQIVFDQATHMSFGDRDFQGKPETENRYHQAILALTTAFWDTHLKSDPDARVWLSGETAKSVLGARDQWEVNPMAKGSR